jgi:hypothetical protein
MGMFSIIGWVSQLLGGKLLELWVVGVCGAGSVSEGGVGAESLAAGGALSCGSHLIEYKLLITCQRIWILILINRRFILSRNYLERGVLPVFGGLGCFERTNVLANETHVVMSGKK